MSVRSTGQKPTICYCPSLTCYAPKPEWCIGRRYEDGFREPDPLAIAQKKIVELETTLTVERKRREECEVVLREVANAPNRIAENSRIIADYFSRDERCP